MVVEKDPRLSEDEHAEVETNVVLFADELFLLDPSQIFSVRIRIGRVQMTTWVMVKRILIRCPRPSFGKASMDVTASIF